MIALIDYGMGNLRSVGKALEKAGAEVLLTSRVEDIPRAEAIVLPGVGAFSQGMKNLTERKLTGAILQAVKEEKPLLGICLGLQLLFCESEEHGICRGLSLLKGRVKRFSDKVKVPHMGWNQVEVRSQGSRVKGQGSKLFAGIPDNSYFYFVHSYYVEPEDKDVIFATTGYGGEFASAIASGSIYGVQFHPEKSSDLGIRVLKNFLAMV